MKKSLHKKTLGKIAKAGIAFTLGFNFLGSPISNYVFADDDDDDDDDYDDYDDSYDDDDSDDDDDDDDFDDDDRIFNVRINGRVMQLSADDYEDLLEDYYDFLDDYYDDNELARPTVAPNSIEVNPEYKDIQIKRNPNFMNPEVTSEDHPSQGLEVAQVLEVQEVVPEAEVANLPQELQNLVVQEQTQGNLTAPTANQEGATRAPEEALTPEANEVIIQEQQTVTGVQIREEKPLPELAQETKDVLYQEAQNNNNINTVTTTNAQNENFTYAVKANEKTQADFNNNIYIDEALLNQEFLALLNADRQAAGLKPLSYGTHLQQGVDKRATDLASIGHIRVDNQPHVRLDGTSFREDFNYLGNQKNALGENTALQTYDGNPNGLVSEKALAQSFYEQWKASPSHYENMMSPDYNYSAISIKMGNKNQLTDNQHNSIIGVQVMDVSK